MRLSKSQESGDTRHGVSLTHIFSMISAMDDSPTLPRVHRITKCAARLALSVNSFFIELSRHHGHGARQRKWKSMKFWVASISIILVNRFLVLNAYYQPIIIIHRFRRGHIGDFPQYPFEVRAACETKINRQSVVIYSLVIIFPPQLSHQGLTKSTRAARTLYFAFEFFLKKLEQPT